MSDVSTPPAVRNGFWILAATILGSSMAFIDGTAVNVALPALQQQLHASATQVQWVIESYSLFLAALLLVGGSLGDLFGRRKIFLVGVGIFAAGSTWCGLSPGILSLILARGLQGVGAALLVPGSLSILTASFPESQRGAAIGLWSGFSAITAGIGPVLGGWLVQHATWRLVFFLNLPLAALILIISVLRVPESRSEVPGQTLDWAGATLATLALGGITFAIIEAQRGGQVVLISGGLGALALLGFLLVEGRVASPMIPFSMFRSRNFTLANLLTFFLYAGLSGMLFFFPINLIQVQHETPTAAGAALLPLILVIFALSRWAGGVADRFGPRMPLLAGALIALVGFALSARPGVGGSYWTTFFPAVAVVGLGMAVSVAPLTTTVMNSESVSAAGIASGINNATSRMAALLSVAVFGLVLASVFNNRLDAGLDALHLPAAERSSVDAQRVQLAALQSRDPRVRHLVEEAFVAGFRRIAWISVGLSIAAALCAVFLTDQRWPLPDSPVAERIEKEDPRIAMRPR